ncbi:hypothetical protein THASP1DRAFT_25555 [Thamnocephalis sphaerospora]|uniref:Heme haloperoxidase family profile domain-containing protein n=1 Tax=Thamnocephalis sphaerospora TaxID=78915 RepID=A0A4P9XJT6_9FUNG|nr:hypothetical protein THASP1DRAFT_25555 [Thamnocephalis sphaerospora]|eukprot:RKP06047.1 hypothetical protein THASP1DRAFT_25555 [Thamnocephalis sphaerospora]
MSLPKTFAEHASDLGATQPPPQPGQHPPMPRRRRPSPPRESPKLEEPPEPSVKKQIAQRVDSLAKSARANTRSLRTRIALFLILALGLYMTYQQILSSRSESQTAARYGKNHIPYWHPKSYQAPGANAVRSPCPMLNTMANHGYIPRDGKNIDVKKLKRALGRMGVAPAVQQQLVAPIPKLGRLKKGMLPHRAKDPEAYEFDLSDLAQHGYLEHDVSLTRADYRPGIDELRHVRVNEALVQQLELFANEHGYLDYASLARARNLRQQQSAQEAAEARKEHKRHTYDQLGKAVEGATTRSLDYGTHAQVQSHAECGLLLELMGRAGRVHVDTLDAFLLHERFPDDWAPPSQQLGRFRLGSATARCLIDRYLPSNWIDANVTSTIAEKMSNSAKMAAEMQDAAKEKAEKMQDAATTKMHEAEKMAKDAQSAAKEKAAEAERKAEEMQDAAKRMMTEAEKKVEEAQSLAKDKMADATKKAEQMQKAAEKKADEMQDAARKTTEDMQKAAKKIVADAEKQAKRAQNAAKEKAGTARDIAKERAEGIWAMSKEKAAEMQDFLDETLSKTRRYFKMGG